MAEANGNAGSGVPPPSTPLRVSSIAFEGLKHTHEDFVQRELAAVREASTLGEVQRRLMAGLAAVRDLDMFQYADVEMRAGPRQAAGEPALTDLVVSVKEKGRLHGKTEVQRVVNRGETQAALTIRARNVFGRGEALRASFVQGHRDSHDVTVALDKPRVAGTRHHGSLEAFRADHNCSLYSSYEARLRGVRATARSDSGAHKVQYECVWRDVAPMDRYEGKPKSKRPATYPGPSAAVVAASEASLKSALSYTYVRDRRDDAKIPRRGTFLRACAELAGLGGDVNFLKAEAAAQKFVPLTHTLALGFGLTAGVARPLAAWAGREAAAGTPLPDRLHLGGPTSVRGFGVSAIGPRQGDDALGGELALAAGVELGFALPNKTVREIGVRGHVYANAGNCVAMPSGPPASHHVRGLLQDLKASVGAGIVVPFPLGRLEVNYSLPVWAGTHEAGLSRFQIGLSAGDWL